MRKVYFDHNATTPIRPEVVEAIQEALPLFGNASSSHGFGREARGRIEPVRRQILELLGAREGEVIFTSGGSESNNLVLKGATCAEGACGLISHKGRHVITTAVEHPSMTITSRCLRGMGYEVTILPVDRLGRVDPEDVRRAIRPETALISVMAANNEVGTLQPVAEVGRIAREAGVLFHTDAVQAFGKIPLDVEEIQADFVSISGHKLNAPKGIGALYMRRGLHICPIIHGGHQEHELRAGTENTLGILALGRAVEVARAEMDQKAAELAALRDRLEQGLLELIPGAYVHGDRDHRLPNTTNLALPGIEGEAILMRLDFAGIAVSTGSACSTGSTDPSPVLSAMGVPPEVAYGSVRISLGYGNDREDVDYALEMIPRAVRSLRELSPLSGA